MEPSQLICNIVIEIVNPLILLLSAGAFVVFIWGIARFIMTTSAGGESVDGKRAMVSGLIGLAIIFGAYGIINLALGTFDLGSYSGPGCRG